MKSQPVYQSQGENVSGWQSVTVWVQQHHVVLLLAMGMLDAFLLGRVYRRVGYLPKLMLNEGLGWYRGVLLVESALVVSLAVVAVAFVLQKSWALKLYFCQFPFRIAFLFLTFGFIDIFSAMQSEAGTWHRMLLLLAVFLELLRLGVTIILFRTRTTAS